MPTIRLTAGEVDYTDDGPRTGRPVVFVHGVFCGPSLWASVIPLLIAEGHRCIAPTWPLGSHVRILGRHAEVTPESVSHMVAELCAALDLNDVMLVGNDSGGAISQLVAVEHPERIGALVLTNCDLAEHFPPKALRPLRLAARSPRLFRAMLTPLRTRAGRRSPLGYRPLAHTDIEDLTRPWVRTMFHVDGALDEARRFMLGVRPQITLRAMSSLSDFTGDIVLPWGDDDEAFPPAHARQFVAAVPKARHIPIAGSRAFVSVDQPTRLAGILAGLTR